MYKIGFYLFLLICLLACKRENKIAAPEVYTTDEKNIISVFNNFILNTTLPMDSIQLYYQQLDSTSTNKQKILAIKELSKAMYYRRTASYYLAILNYNKALEKLDTNDSLAYYAYSGIGMTNKNLGIFPNALKNFQLALDNSEYRKDTNHIASIYAALSQLYFEKNDIKKSKGEIEKVFKLLEHQPKSKPYLVALHTLANIEGSSGNFEKALELDYKGLALIGDNPNDVSKASFQDNMARCYLYLYKDYDKAEYFFKENLKIDKQINNTTWIADTYINLAEVETERGQFEQAQNYLQEAINIFSKNNELINVLKAYNVLTELYVRKGDYKMALSAKKEYSKQYENYINAVSEQSFVEFNTVYETEKKEKALANTKLKLAKETAVSKQKNFWLIVLGSLIFISLIIAASIRKNAALKHKQLQLEKQLIQEQAKTQIQNHRLEISRDLHDSIGSQLTFINSILESIKSSSKLDDVIKSKINTLSDFSESSIAELKSTIWALNSNTIYLQDLKNRILNFIKNAAEAEENVQFNFSFDVKNNIALNSKQAIYLFRTIQEIINNAIKHAKAEAINITINQQDENLHIIVSDNGIGFDFEKEKEKSFGLSNIQNRIDEINGNVQIHSEKNIGTNYTIDLNLKS